MPTATLEPVDEPVDLTAVDRRAVAREGVRRLYGSMSELPPAGRIAFALHAIEGRPMVEVAALMSASITATKVRVWRARRALRRAALRDPVLNEFLGGALEDSP